MNQGTVAEFNVTCPRCCCNLEGDLPQCRSCQIQIPVTEGFINLLPVANRSGSKNDEAYAFYALFYAPISLLAYWLVWRGKILQHIKFFNEILTNGDTVLDIATGDGSLTKLAMYGRSLKVRRLLCIDVSVGMLRKARKKLAKYGALFAVGDVEALSFPDQQIKLISCFGGLNSFPNTDKALQELKRILHPEGVIRGSALLFPAAPWRQRLIQHWIRKGYQSTTISKESLLAAFERQKFDVRIFRPIGDVVLFELGGASG